MARHAARAFFCLRRVCELFQILNKVVSAMLFRRFLFGFVMAFAAHAHALTTAEAVGMATGETDARIEALNRAVASPDDKTAAFLKALSDDAVKVAGEQVFVMRDGKGFDPVTGAAVAVTDTADDVINNNRMRGEIDTALASLKLFSKDDKTRAEGIKSLQNESDEAKLPLIEKAFAAEQNPQLKDQLGLIRAAVLLNSADKSKRLIAATLLAQSGQAST